MDSSYKLVYLLSFLFLTNFVFALGVNSPYWQGNPLKVKPGDVREISFPLVNSLNEKTTQASVNLTQGKEIAEIISGTNYTVESGSSNKNIVLRITIPQNAKIGDGYNVNFSVLYSPQQQAGTVQLNVKYNVDFPVIVSNETDVQPVVQQVQTFNNAATPQTPSSFSNVDIILIVVLILACVIILIVIVVLLVKRKRQENSFK